MNNLEDKTIKEAGMGKEYKKISVRKGSTSLGTCESQIFKTE
jgi:hypothetical protein